MSVRLGGSVGSSDERDEAVGWALREDRSFEDPGK